MVAYMNGAKLLTNAYLPPQWNLLTGTKDFSGWQFKNAFPADKKDYLGNDVYKSYSWNQAYTSIDLVKDIWYTFSWITDSNDKALPYVQSDTGTEIDVTYTKTVTLLERDNFYRQSISFKLKQSQRVRIFITSADLYQVSSYKLERGETATDWMPAIADLQLKSQNGGVKPRLKPLSRRLEVA